MTSLRRRRSSFDDEPAQYKEKTAGVGTALQFSLLLSPGSTYRTTHTAPIVIMQKRRADLT